MTKRPSSELGFRYLVEPEVIPFVSERNIGFMATNLFEIRVTLRWPLIPAPTTFPITNYLSRRPDQWIAGPGKRTFRTLVAGHLEKVPTGNIASPWFYWFHPNDYQVTAQ